MGLRILSCLGKSIFLYQPGKLSRGTRWIRKDDIGCLRTLAVFAHCKEVMVTVYSKQKRGCIGFAL